MIKDKIYWIALSDRGILKTERINKLLADIFIDKGSDLRKFFKISYDEFKKTYSLADSETEFIISLNNNLQKYRQIENELESENIDTVPVNSGLFSKQLKQSLKFRTPFLLYVKGDKKLLNRDSAAVVGARTSSDLSLQFTDEIVKKLTEKKKVIVSGYAKGVDRQALDSALKYNGESIIVLPQGILTFKSEMRKYRIEIDNGKLLVLSTYFPKSPWSVPNAMARNTIIYGLSEEIYVAESNNKGGTWSGVQEGLKRNQKIFVRMPGVNEVNANRKLIESGAIALEWESNKEIDLESVIMQVSDKPVSGTEDLILETLTDKPKTSKYIKDKLKIEWSTNKITAFLKSRNDIEIIKGRPMMFSRKSEVKQIPMF